MGNKYKKPKLTLFEVSLINLKDETHDVLFMFTTYEQAQKKKVELQKTATLLEKYEINTLMIYKDGSVDYYIDTKFN